MFRKLKQKWNVNWFQFALIFTTFALGGSLCARLGNVLLRYFLPEESLLFWVFYVPIVTILWPMCVLIISVPFGQFNFFKNYLIKIKSKIFTKNVP
jgi:hypothetical protein